MSYLTRGRDLRAYANVPLREKLRSEGKIRDKGARLTLEVFEARKREGPRPFARWLLADDHHLGEQLQSVLDSHDERATLRGVQMLFWMIFEVPPSLPATESYPPAVQAQLAARYERYAQAGHSERRAMNWAAGTTRRQQRAKRDRRSARRNSTRARAKAARRC